MGHINIGVRKLLVLANAAMTKQQEHIAELEAENDRLVETWISPVLAGAMSEKIANLEKELFKATYARYEEVE